MRALCLPLLAIFLTGCDEIDLGNIGSSDRYREDFHHSFPLNAGGSVRLDNFNGSVEISGWDKNTVDIDGTKYANTEYRLKEMKIEFVPSVNSINIRTVPPLDRHGNAGARYTIHVPRHTELAGIVTSNGPIRVDTIEGSTHLRTSNGAVHATRLLGPLEVQTSNGSIEVSEVTGDTTLRSSNGTIRADIRKGGFGARTSNGSITVRLMEPDSSPVRLESSNGHIELTMNAAREVHASTSNSSITVRMPASAGATVNAHTSNSSITCDFDVTLHGELRPKHHLEGTIGNGGPLLDLGTSNGSIKLLRM
jgi:Putative adhesin